MERAQGLSNGVDFLFAGTLFTRRLFEEISQFVEAANGIAVVALHGLDLADGRVECGFGRVRGNVLRGSGGSVDFRHGFFGFYGFR